MRSVHRRCADSDGSVFRDFVLILQTDVENYAQGGPTVADILYGAINYKFEPFNIRGTQPQPSPVGFAKAYSNSALSPEGDPETPIFKAAKGMPTRFRILFPGGSASNTPEAPPALQLDG